MDSAKLVTLQFLEFYGLLRLQGNTPNQALQPVFQPPEDAIAVFEAMAETGSLRNQATQADVAGKVGTMGQIVGMVPVVGTIANLVLSGFGLIIQEIMKYTAISCEKDCRSPESYRRRTMVGINPPPQKREYDYETLMPTYVHDGLVVDGAGMPGSVDRFGRVIGVQTRIKTDRLPGMPCALWGWGGCPGWNESQGGPNWTMGADCGIPGKFAGQKHRYNWWMRNAFFTPSLAEGDFENPWKQPGNNYYYRAWRVQKMLEWLRDKATCSHLLCMGAQLHDLKQVLIKAQLQLRDGGSLAPLPAKPSLRECEPVATAMREKGSRWFASMYFLHKDIWDILSQMAPDKGVDLIQSVGDTKMAAAYKLHRNGTQWPASAQPWEWYPVTSNMGFEKGIKLLRKIYDPATWTVQVMPGFETARAILSATRQPQIMVRPELLASARLVRHATAVTHAQHQREKNNKLAIATGAGVLVLGAGLILYLAHRKAESQKSVPNPEDWHDD